MSQDVALRAEVAILKRRCNVAFAMIYQALARVIPPAPPSADAFYVVNTVAEIQAGDFSSYLMIACKADANGDFAIYLQDSGVLVIDGLNGVQDAVGTKFELQK